MVDDDYSRGVWNEEEGIYQPISETISEIIVGYVRSGQGIQKLDCGTKKFAIACPEKHHVEFFMNHCSRLQCPVCMDHAIRRIVNDVVERLTMIVVEYKRRGIKPGNLKHIVFSIPKDKFSKNDLEADSAKELNDEFNKVLKKSAKDKFYGCVAFLHCERLNDLTGEWEWGPHFHVVGYGYYQDSQEVYKKTGWIYHVIKNTGERNLVTTIAYELGHCALFIGSDGKQKNRVIKWLGFLSNAKIEKEVVKTVDEQQLCPTCKCPMHRYGLSQYEEDKFVNWSYDQGEILHTKEFLRWKIRDHRKKKSKQDEFQ